MENSKYELTKIQKTVLSELAKSDLKNVLYWTGGTALAYFHLQHRLSYDIDLFSDKPLEHARLKELISKISKIIELKKIKEEKIFDRWEFILSNGSETRVDLVAYDYKNINPRKNWQGIQVDSLDDMIANKTMALIDRNEPKDAFDVYHILTKLNLTVEKLLSLVKKKFDSDFTASLFWSRCLLGARNFESLKPLVGNNNNEIFGKVNNYFEQQSAKNIKSFLDQS